jgi:hypothetical protein
MGRGGNSAQPNGLRDVDAALLAETLCIEEKRIVARDNTILFGKSPPATLARAHYVKANVKVRQYPDGSLALFRGPDRLARYGAAADQPATSD